MMILPLRLACTGLLATGCLAQLNGNLNDPASTAAALIAAFAAARGGGEFHVPPGQYVLDNHAGPLVVTDFGGHAIFDSGAQLVFTDNTQGGLLFIGGQQARITGLRATYQTPAVKRVTPNEEIKFSETTDTLVEGAVIENGPSVGLLFYSSIRPRVKDLTVRHTMADGLHFANCHDPQVDGLTASDTGDDGLAFVNYEIYPDRSGGSASNINVRRSKARGIAVVGHSNIRISGFVVDGTASSGILCAKDDTFRTRIPANVRFENGTIAHAGTVQPLVGNQFGIEYNDQASCSFSHISVRDVAGRGVAGRAFQGSVTLDQVRVADNRTREAFSFSDTAQVTIFDSTSEHSPSYAFLFLNCQVVQLRNLTVIDAARQDPLHRVVWFENGGSVAANGLTISGGRRDPVAAVIGAHQDPGYSQSGRVSGILSRLSNVKLQVQNDSPGLEFSVLTP